MATKTVTDAQELAAALEAKASEIVVEGTISGTPSITLPEGTTLRGGTLVFTGKGVRLTKNNVLKDVTVSTVEHEVAIYNDTTIPDAGTLRLENVETVGQVYLVAEDALRTIRVEADGLHVTAADVRGRERQPHGFGVDVLQGGITLWNLQADPSSEFTATLKGLQIGTPATPVRGSGVFVAGHADREGKGDGGVFRADLIETGEIVTDGGIVPDTGDKISGGVFVVSGADVQRVENNGPVTTHGANDMVLDLWGHVAEWVANAPITSTGPSGIGFVNFGDLDRLEVNAPIATAGLGARGFNVYDGTLGSASFDSVTTHGDGAIGVQVSKPTGPIEVKGDITTTGGEGMSLVKGVQTKLKASGVSVKPGGRIASLTIGGRVLTSGPDVVSFEVLEDAAIDELDIAEGVLARGAGSSAVKIEGSIPDGVQLER